MCWHFLGVEPEAIVLLSRRGRTGEFHQARSNLEGTFRKTCWSNRLHTRSHKLHRQAVDFRSKDQMNWENILPCIKCIHFRSCILDIHWGTPRINCYRLSSKTIIHIFHTNSKQNIICRGTCMYGISSSLCSHQSWKRCLKDKNKGSIYTCKSRKLLDTTPNTCSHCSLPSIFHPLRKWPYFHPEVT